MQTDSRLIATAVIVSVMLITGCETEQMKQEREARHQRELQLASQSAAASATTQVMESQKTELANARSEALAAGETRGKLLAIQDMERREEKARQEGIAVGKVLGQKEAIQNVEQRETKARENGYQTGLIEGEAKGHSEGMTAGEKIGYAKAAADEFKKGQQQGEIYGAIKGRSEATKEAEQKVIQAEQRGVARGIEQGRLKGIEEGKAYQRRESFYKVAGVALCISACFAAMLFFLYTRLQPGSVATIQRMRAEERQRELEYVQRTEEDRQRFLTLMERVIDRSADDCDPTILTSSRA